MKLQDLENIEDCYIDEGFLCIKLISCDHLRINFNSIEAIKKQFSIPVVTQRSELLQKIESVKNFEWGINPVDNENRMCELIKLL